MHRIYTDVIQEHFKENQRMFFLAGPRRVGKTTIALHTKKKAANFYYLNWDNDDHRHIIIRGPKAVSDYIAWHQLSLESVTLVLDEIHKYRRWKTFLKTRPTIVPAKTFLSQIM